jgi:hypothetical protein
MEFSFEIPAWLVAFVSNPMHIVIWAAFGVFFFAILIFLVLLFLEKIFANKISFRKIITPLIAALLISWIPGFISMILFTFLEISAIKMAFIWISMFVGYVFFSIANQREIDRLLNI